jgi:hypothetical protein
MSSFDEKTPEFNVGNRTGSSEGGSSAAAPTNHAGREGTSTSSASVDQAWKFLNENRDAADETDTSSVDMTALRRKIDFRVVPLMFLCYTMQFLDKVILNVCVTCLSFLGLGVSGCWAREKWIIMDRMTDIP